MTDIHRRNAAAMAGKDPGQVVTAEERAIARTLDAIAANALAGRMPEIASLLGATYGQAAEWIEQFCAGVLGMYAPGREPEEGLVSTDQDRPGPDGLEVSARHIVSEAWSHALTENAQLTAIGKVVRKAFAEGQARQIRVFDDDRQAPAAQLVLRDALAAVDAVLPMPGPASPDTQARTVAAMRHLAFEAALRIAEAELADQRAHDAREPVPVPSATLASVLADIVTEYTDRDRAEEAAERFFALLASCRAS